MIVCDSADLWEMPRVCSRLTTNCHQLRLWWVIRDWRIIFIRVPRCDILVLVNIFDSTIVILSALSTNHEQSGKVLTAWTVHSRNSLTVSRTQSRYTGLLWWLLTRARFLSRSMYITIWVFTRDYQTTARVFSRLSNNIAWVLPSRFQVSPTVRSNQRIQHSIPEKASQPLCIMGVITFES